MNRSFQEWREGWPALLGAMLGTTAGVTLFAQLQGFFVVPLQTAFGWSRGQVSLASVAIVLTSLTMPIVGQLVDRLGPRRLLLAGTLLFVLAYGGFAVMPGHYWVYMALIAFIGLVAGPVTSPLVVTRPLVDAFEHSRGLALAIGTSGSVIISALLIPPLQQVITHWGWRAAYALLIPIALVCGLLAFVLLGRRPPASGPATTAETPVASGAPGSTLAGALRDPRFWLLAGSIICNCLVSGGFAIHMQPLLGDLHVPLATAALVGSAFAAAMFVGRLVGGVLLDHYKPTVVASIALSGPTLGLLVFLTPAPSLPLMFVGTALIGLAMGAEGNVLAFFIARYFGLRAFGAIIGLLGLMFGLSMAGGAIGVGLMFDRLGDYRLALQLGSGLALASALLMAAAGWVNARRPLGSPLAVDAMAPTARRTG